MLFNSLFHKLVRLYRAVKPLALVLFLPASITLLSLKEKLKKKKKT